MLSTSLDAARVCWPLESGGGAPAAAGGLHCGAAQLRGGVALPDAAVRECAAGGGEAFAVSSLTLTVSDSCDRASAASFVN